eukprot:COSAG06_NODE_23603_length_686_cov_2.398637_1_plen_124_part_10
MRRRHGGVDGQAVATLSTIAAVLPPGAPMLTAVARRAVGRRVASAGVGARQSFNSAATTSEVRTKDDEINRLRFVRRPPTRHVRPGRFAHAGSAASGAIAPREGGAPTTGCLGLVCIRTRCCAS